eukprot:g770.t1
MAKLTGLYYIVLVFVLLAGLTVIFRLCKSRSCQNWCQCLFDLFGPSPEFNFTPAAIQEIRAKKKLRATKERESRTRQRLRNLELKVQKCKEALQTTKREKHLLSERYTAAKKERQLDDDLQTATNRIHDWRGKEIYGDAWDSIKGVFGGNSSSDSQSRSSVEPTGDIESGRRRSGGERDRAYSSGRSSSRRGEMSYQRLQEPRDLENYGEEPTDMDYLSDDEPMSNTERESFNLNEPTDKYKSDTSSSSKGVVVPALQLNLMKTQTPKPDYVEVPRDEGNEGIRSKIKPEEIADALRKNQIPWTTLERTGLFPKQ